MAFLTARSWSTPDQPGCRSDIAGFVGSLIHKDAGLNGELRCARKAMIITETHWRDEEHQIAHALVDTSSGKQFRAFK